MRDFDLRELQLCELDIMKEFIRICDKHQLQYYMGYGSLLGAVRHQGFIPWDDDIDLHMPWDDYMKFKKLCATELNSAYTYDDWYLHHDYYLHWGKLRKNETTCMAKNEAELRIHWGVGIDIFPLFSSDRPSLTLSKKFASFMLRFCLKRAHTLYNNTGWRTRVKRILYFLIPKQFDEIIMTYSMRKLGDASKHAEWFYLPELANGYSVQFFSKSVFGEGIKKKFERIVVLCPTDYDSYLNIVYGEDYMEVPKVEDRVDHGEIIVDLKKHYTIYQQEYIKK